MTAVALIAGTLFWLVVFFCIMSAIYVFMRDGFGATGALEAAVFLGLMVVMGAPLAVLARWLSAQAVAASARRDAGPPPGSQSTTAAPGGGVERGRGGRRRRRGR